MFPLHLSISGVNGANSFFIFRVADDLSVVTSSFSTILTVRVLRLSLRSSYKSSPDTSKVKGYKILLNSHKS